MQRTWRVWWRHLWLDRGDVHRALGPGASERLRDSVARSEQRHTGEIRVCVEAALPWRYLWQGATPRSRALAMFAKLGVWDTESNNGVLIYVLLADRAIEIVADRGIANRLPSAHWQAVVDRMRATLHGGSLELALQGSIETVGTTLEGLFARSGDTTDRNELSDEPSLH